MSEAKKYTYRVTWSEADGEYVALCSEFPSLSWLAKTREEALTGLEQVVADVISEMKANKEVVPEAFSTREFSGKLVLRIPPELHRKLTIEAEEQGVSLNRLISVKLADGPVQGSSERTVEAELKKIESVLEKLVLSNEVKTFNLILSQNVDVGDELIRLNEKEQEVPFKITGTGAKYHAH